MNFGWSSMVASKPAFQLMGRLALPVLAALFLLSLAVSKAVILPTASLGSTPFELAALYPADLLALLIVAVWTSQRLSAGWSARRQLKPAALAVLGFLALLALSLAGAHFGALGLTQWLHVAGALAVAGVMRATWPTLRPAVLGGLIALGVVEALAGLMQFSLQRDLGLSFLGEPALGPALAGVAKISLGAERVIRAYGTLPHPNVLAMLLSVSALVMIGWYLTKPLHWPLGRLLFWAALPVLFLGLLATFSRTVMALTIIGLTIFLFLEWRRRHADRREIAGVALIGLFSLLAFSAAFWPLVASRGEVSLSDQAISQRVFHLRVADNLILENPALGVGAGNYVSAMRSALGPGLAPWFYEPVHNLYLLVAAEAGLPALFVFGLLIFFLLRRGWFSPPSKHSPLKRAFLIAALVFMAAALLDHYAWTTNAGRYLWWLVLGVV